MKKLVLLAMMLGLLIAGTARAEGAWVLWSFTVTEEDIDWQTKGERGDAFATPSIVDGFPSYESCRKELIEHVKLGRARSNVTKFVPENGYGIKTGDTISYTVYKCLPESVDPRKK